MLLTQKIYLGNVFAYGSSNQLPCDYAYIEFSQQSSVPLALQNSDTLEFQGRTKPQKTADQSLEELEEATRRGAVVNTGEIGRGYSPSNIGALASIPPMQMAGISSTLFSI
uniref:RRM domain-containing protein n=1 Tax=Meloidogyne hapla TaxID=6305 RepID=A0A1I8BHI7_MELHA